MINIISKKCPCGKQPNFGFSDDETPTCCKDCKKDGMINIISKKCKANEQEIPCPILGNTKYDGYCTHCFSNLFPSDPRTQQIRKKSKEILTIWFYEAILESLVIDRRSREKSQAKYINSYVGWQDSEVFIGLNDVIPGFVWIIDNKIKEEDQAVRFIIWHDLPDNFPRLCYLNFTVKHLVNDPLAS